MLNRLKIIKLMLLMLLFSITSCLQAAADNWQMNMPKGVTIISKEIYSLHMIAFFICVIIGVLVFGVMFYSIIKHRKSRGVQPASFHDNLKLEIVWSIIPFIILVALAFPATKVLIRMNDTQDSDITIKIVGLQWKWQYQYMNQGISYYSNLSTPYNQIQNTTKKGQWYLLEVDKPLVVPINKKIRFLVTSNDVIHSWWVPELGIKRDAIPGFMHESWAIIEKPGVYRGQCTELCGINHGFMPIVVEAVSEDDFDKWVIAQPKVEDIYSLSVAKILAPKVMTKEELMSLGKDKYEQVCVACHRGDGKGIPPMFPALKGSSISIGRPISRHINLILDGVPGSVMQAYKDQLTDSEIAAIVTYERNAWENNTGDIVQESEVKKVREEHKQVPKIVKKAGVGALR